MLSILLFTLGLAAPFSTTSAKFDIKDLQTNTAFNLSVAFTFPDSATRPTWKPIVIPNPGPRPDNYQIFISLGDVKGKEIRPILYDETPAKNGPFNFQAEYLLPSYILKDNSEFTLIAKLHNVDNLMDVLFKRSTTVVSPKFKLIKSSDPQVADTVFENLGDQKDGDTVSLFYTMWTGPDGPQRQLIQAKFDQNGGITTQPVFDV